MLAMLSWLAVVLDRPALATLQHLRVQAIAGMTVALSSRDTPWIQKAFRRTSGEWFETLTSEELMQVGSRCQIYRLTGDLGQPECGARLADGTRPQER